MTTINKVHILSAIFSIIIAASGAFGYFTHFKLNSVSDTSSSEIFSINKADISMRSRIKRDEHIGKNSDIGGHNLGFKRTEGKVTQNPDPYNQSLQLNVQARKTINDSRVIDYSIRSEEDHICTDSFDRLINLSNWKNKIFTYWIVDFVNFQRIGEAFKKKLPLIDPLFDELFTNLDGNCQKDEMLYQNVCTLLKDLIANENELNRFLNCTEVTNLSPINAEIEKIFKSLYDFYKEKWNFYECNSLTINPNNADNAANTTNFNSTELVSMMCLKNGGSSIGKIFFEKNFDMLKLEKMLFLLLLLKLHF